MTAAQSGCRGITLNVYTAPAPANAKALAPGMVITFEENSQENQPIRETKIKMGTAPRLPSSARIGWMLLRSRIRLGSRGCWLSLAAMSLALWGVPAGSAQGSVAFPAPIVAKHKKRPPDDRLPEKPTFPPALSIPVEPLGFSGPGPLYLGQRNSLVSLGFLDDNRLLFAFRVPGLMRREEGSSASEDERQIRALVLALPSGNVTAEALWKVHDRVRFLWMLKNGQFLFRDRDDLSQGDAALTLKPLLHFPGPLLWMDMDPSQQFLVTSSREPAPSQPTPTKEGDVSSPDAARADMAGDNEKSSAPPDLVVRILKRDSGQVMLVSRTRRPVHLPVNSDGYIESLRANGDQWLLNLNFFSGGTKVLGKVNSSCSPGFDFVSEQVVLVTACEGGGAYKLVALGTDGKHLWEDRSSPQAIWPILVMAPDGSRLARETLTVNHAVNAYSPLDAGDIKGQLVKVFDAADGKVQLEAQASPAFDAGGNVAISPSGRRLALLHAGAIEIFDLPLPTPPPDAPKAQAGP